MADALAGGMLTVLVGFVTGGMAVPIFIGWVMRKAGDPRATGRQVGLALWAATLIWAELRRVAGGRDAVPVGRRDGGPLPWVADRGGGLDV